jgi:hypothetical protein
MPHRVLRRVPSSRLGFGFLVTTFPADGSRYYFHGFPEVRGETLRSPLRMQSWLISDAAEQ